MKRKTHHSKTLGQLIPDLHIIRSYVNADLGWSAALAEFVDNSFAADAGAASVISFTIGPNEITIEDDGSGLQNVNALFRLGQSESKFSKSDIGLYGVGAKAASLWLGYEISVETIKKGFLHQHTVNWSRARKWPSEYAGSGKRTTRRSGTTITIKKVHAGRSRLHMDALCRLLGMTFAPALREGRHIKITDTRRKYPVIYEVETDEPPEPILTHKRSFSGEIKGAAYGVFIGAKEKYESRHNALFINFGHRVIEIDRNPWKDRRALPISFYGRVDLADTWKTRLSTNKTAVALYRDELLDAIYEQCKDLLELLSDYEKELELELCLDDIGARLSQVMRTTRAGGKYGGMDIIPITTPHQTYGKPTPEPRGKLISKQEGDRDGDKQRKENDQPTRLLKIIPRSLGEDAHRVTEEAGTFIIELNIDLNYVKEAITKPLKVSALWAMVCTALCSYLQWTNHRLARYSELQPIDRFAKMLCDYLSRMPQDFKQSKLRDVL